MYFDTNLLSKYRTHLMGFAILLIVFFHTKDLQGLQMVFPLRFLHKTAYWGVDMFFLLSGLGVYFAFQNNSLQTFFQKRLLRLLPFYLPIAFLFNLILYSENFINIQTLIIRFFLLDSFDSPETAFNGLGWYIPVQLFFYFLTPAIIGTIKFEKTWLVILIFLTLQILGVITIHQMLNRLGVYILGIYLGYLIKNNKKINVPFLFISFIIGFILQCLNYYYVADPFWGGNCGVIHCAFITLPICAFLALIFSHLKHIFILPFLGTYTLSIYIFHERILLLLRYYDVQMLHPAALSILMTLIVAYLWQNLINYLLKKTTINY